MKILFSLALIFAFGLNVAAQTKQSKTISKEEYDRVFQFAISETNIDYPVIYSVNGISFAKGKAVSTKTETSENESEGYERIKRTVLENGKRTDQYQITIGFYSIYCSDDGIKWSPPSQYDCRNEAAVGLPRTPESSQYSVAVKTVKGKQFKIYREYSVFPSLEEGQKKRFSETVATIDSRGFFVTVETTEGTLDPKTVRTVNKESWVTKAKIKPIVAPTKND